MGKTRAALCAKRAGRLVKAPCRAAGPPPLSRRAQRPGNAPWAKRGRTGTLRLNERRQFAATRVVPREAFAPLLFGRGVFYSGTARA